MNRTIERKHVWLGLIMLATLLGVLSAVRGGPIAPFGICGYLLLALVPGAALYLLISREPDILECLLAATALSPVLTTTAGVVGMLSGIPAPAVSVLLVVLAGAAGLLAVRRGRLPVNRLGLTRNQALALFALLLVVSAAVSYLPLTRDWWRIRADAWFHGAVVAQIRDFGIPPEDPYVFGLPLQYMWFYHVLVVILSQASGIGPFVTMTLLSVQALVAFGAAAFLFSSLFKKTFAHNYAATLTVLFGMNAAFWVFIPINMLRALTGDVRGMNDVARVVTLRPFDIETVRRFVVVGYNQQFLLDKFMVSTALSFGLCLMAVLWWAVTKYIAEQKRDALVAASIAAFGVVAFHTAIGSLVFGGVLGGLFLLIVLRRVLGGYDIRPLVNLLAALAVCGVLLLPYLHSVTYAKAGGQTAPLGLSASKMIGILVSCALVIFLAAFQARKVFRTKDVATYFLICTTLSVAGICTIVNLPAANSYDKLPFLVFFPLAIVGGWTIADFSVRGRTPKGKRARYVVAGLLAFAPLNLLLLAAYYHSPRDAGLTENEKHVAVWVRAHTPRESIMLDTNENRFLLVAGPRRYYLANEAAAKAWGYDREEIAKRKRIIDDVCSAGPLEPLTLETLGSMPYPVYVIVTKDDETADRRRFSDDTEPFEQKCSIGSMSVFEVNRALCRQLYEKAVSGGGK